MRFTNLLDSALFGEARAAHFAHIDEEIFKKSPHVIGSINFLHLDLGVDVTMIEEVDVRGFDLSYAVFVRHHVDDVFQRKKEMAFNLRVNVLSCREQFN